MSDYEWGGETIDPYPMQVRETLAYHKKSGTPFRTAWDSAMAKHRPRESWRKRIAAPESPLDVLKRACEAAYHDVPLVSPYDHEEAA